eukprot:5371696-Pleurochrysis_carterae.AAC.1
MAENGARKWRERNSAQDRHENARGEWRGRMAGKERARKRLFAEKGCRGVVEAEAAGCVPGTEWECARAPAATGRACGRVNVGRECAHRRGDAQSKRVPQDTLPRLLVQNWPT